MAAAHPPGADREAAIRQCLDAAADALGDLDAQVNGREQPFSRRAIPLGRLLGELEQRWRPRGRVTVGVLPAVTVSGDPHQLAAALDNLVANGLAHGGGAVRIAAAVNGAVLRLQVRNAGSGGRPSPVPSDPRRGHGLRIASRVAERHRGAILGPSADGDGVLTELELPVARTGPGRS